MAESHSRRSHRSSERLTESPTSTEEGYPPARGYGRGSKGRRGGIVTVWVTVLVSVLGGTVVVGVSVLGGTVVVGVSVLGGGTVSVTVWVG
jgi:hypothetical protein